MVSAEERNHALAIASVKQVPKFSRSASVESGLAEIFVSDIPVHHEDDGFMTNFRRITISEAEEEHSDETRRVCKNLLDSANLRNKYQFQFSQQNWGAISEDKFAQRVAREKKELQDKGGRNVYRRRPDPPFVPFPEDQDDNIFRDRDHKFGPEQISFEFVDGVVKVTVSEAEKAKGRKEVQHPPSKDEFYKDLQLIIKTMHDAACKSFCFMRLKLLESLFELHMIMNSDKENAVQRTVPHRDFYNIRKVDTHMHHSAIMNQKHLLRFIKSKLKRFPDEIVLKRDDKVLSLSEVFHSLKLTAYDLSIDTLDMHADNTFHRFDRFNLKYNPVGESRLREIFLKTDNLIEGRYLAEITQEVFSDCEANKYVLLEPRVSIYGRNIAEWSKLSKWYYANKLGNATVRWMIQVPRLYSIYKSLGLVNTFQDMLDNIFKPLFEVTLDPSSNKELDCFLTQVSGFDCVDDESVIDRINRDTLPVPSEWDLPDNPPYSYWTYYLYANLFSLNSLRQSLGMSTFAFRPHAGEAGDVNNLASTFLCAQHINHGILLRKAPTLQYLYYLKQVGLAMSPLSNNKLFLDYHSNPFPSFFARGLNVSLSTDDPLLLHMTKDPLLEEYAVASQVWRFSSTDQCEIARNSVLQSGFEHPYKEHYLGKGYYEHNVAPHYGNNITHTNVPDIRVIYRRERLEAEWDFIRGAAAEHSG